MNNETIDLSTSKLSFCLQPEDQRLILKRFCWHAEHLQPCLSWLHEDCPSGLFAVYVNGIRYGALDMSFTGVHERHFEPGFRQTVLSFQGSGFEVNYLVNGYEDTALIEMWLELRNSGTHPFRVERLDSFSINLPSDEYQLLSFTGDWGSEFEPQQIDLTDRVILESRAGRSSKGSHPWFALIRGGQQFLSGSVAWSGNWIFRFEPLEAQGYQISGGLHEWNFYKMLLPGEALESPPVVLVLGDSLNTVSQQYARVGRRFWYPRNKLSASLPVEWNHWWSYEDFNLNERVFSQNAEKAAELGIEVCTLDAGWFGPSEAGTHWYDYRGDWHHVNQSRFPSGIRCLADQVKSQQMSFGLWCEIEGLGMRAQLAEEHPEFVATRAGERLGYLCFGNPAVQEWAFQTLSRLIREFNCDWIKLDFNLDPGAGCDRTDHGHQAGDGLYEHYRGYYRFLDRVRQAFPQVILENCSSGGLRIDLGILRRTHMTYLSDPDWPVHDLQIFWGASTMLAPNVLLHWSFSDWCNRNPPPQQTFNPHDPHLTQKQLDYYTRISMLGLFGLSQKLPDLPDWVAERLKTHIRLYKEVVRRFVREADLYRLTEQPRRSGLGERWCAFQYSLPDKSEHLLFVFRLPGAEPQKMIRLCDLQPDRLYMLESLEGGRRIEKYGTELMKEGLLFDSLEEEDSALIQIY